METHGDHQSNNEFEDNPQPTSFADNCLVHRLDVAFTKQGFLSKTGLVMLEILVRRRRVVCVRGV